MAQQTFPDSYQQREHVYSDYRVVMIIDLNSGLKQNTSVFIRQELLKSCIKNQHKINKFCFKYLKYIYKRPAQL